MNYESIPQSYRNFKDFISKDELKRGHPFIVKKNKQVRSQSILMGKDL